MSKAQLFKHADFTKIGISRVHVLGNTDMGRWLGCGQFIVCYNQDYIDIEEQVTASGIYDLSKDTSSRDRRVFWKKTPFMAESIDVDNILSRFDSIGAPLARDEYLGNPLTVDYARGKYYRGSVRKCYILSSRYELADIKVDKILVRKSYYDFIRHVSGSGTEVYGKAPHLPVIFGKYNDNSDFRVTGVLMPINTEERTFEYNFNCFSKSLWESVKV